MDGLNWKIIKHKDLTQAECLRIAQLKDEHWPYGLESQIQWMAQNIGIEDVHLMGEEQDGKNIILNAYITLTNIKVMIDNHNITCIGVGGVCVEKDLQHSGVGRLLMHEAEKYIVGQDKLGILLCKDSLIPFYSKCGWNIINYLTAVVAEKEYEYNIMLLGKSCHCSNIIIDRNF